MANSLLQTYMLVFTVRNVVLWGDRRELIVSSTMGTLVFKMSLPDGKTTGQQEL